MFLVVTAKQHAKRLQRSQIDGAVRRFEGNGVDSTTTLLRLQPGHNGRYSPACKIGMPKILADCSVTKKVGTFPTRK